MSFSEPNLHSRNLKFISILFILYWALGLQPIDHTIRLMFMNYEIKNPELLPIFSHTFLFYFAWRFYLNAKKRVLYGYRETFAIHSFNNFESSLYKKLHKIAKNNYIINYKEEAENFRFEKAKQKGIELSDQEYSLYLRELKHENDKIRLVYQVDYPDRQIAEYNNRQYQIPFKWFHLIPLKTHKLFVFLLSKEDTPDYLLPWCLFLFALATNCLPAINN